MKLILIAANLTGKISLGKKSFREFLWLLKYIVKLVENKRLNDVER